VKTLVYKGIIHIRKNGDYYDHALAIGTMQCVLAEELKSTIDYKKVSVRYWISNTEKSKKQLKEDFLKSLSGRVQANYGDNYTELSGYTGTVERAKIGGHDLIQELRTFIGKFVYLEIDVHNP